MMQYNHFQPQIFPQVVGQKVYTLYIGDLDEQIDDNQLYNLFQNFGQITHIKIQKDFETKQSKGFAFISFLQQQDAENAKKEMNHQMILSKQIRVCNKRSTQEFNIEANIVIKNLPNFIEINEIDQYFSQFGNIFSSRLIQKNQVAFIQFDKKDPVQKILELQNTKPFILKGQQIQVFQFQRRIESKIQKTNIYLKNFPDMPEQEINQKLQEFCQKFGKITSILVKTNKDIAKQFAFVCYEKSEDAQNAFEQFKTAKLFSNEALYVNWAQTRQERNKKLKDTLSNIQNETNIFVKNLKSSVTKQLLQEKFSKYGEIQSCEVKAPQQKSQRSIIETKFGFINFMKKEDARKTLIVAQESEQIQELFQDGKAFINFHLLKSQTQNYQMMRKVKPMPMVPNMNMINPMQNYYMGGRPQMLQPIISKGKSNNPQVGMPQKMQQQQFNMMYQNMNPYQMQQNVQMQYNQAMQFQGQPIQKQKQGQNNFDINFQQQQLQQQIQMQQQIQQQIQLQNMSIQNIANIQQNPQNFHNIQQQLQKPIIQNQKNTKKIVDANPIKKEFGSIKEIQQKLDKFKVLNQDDKRTILGEFLFPMIEKSLAANEKDQVPKITGMLIDFDVFEVEDILKMFEDRSVFQERVQEAQELIYESMQQQE